MGIIRMKIQALDWTMGEVANVFVGLKGGEGMIDWGDGHTSVFQAHPREVYPQYESHMYPCKCKTSGDIFDVVITSTEDNIVFLNTGCIDMAIIDLDLTQCPELERLDLTRPVKSLELSHNQALELLQIKGYDNPRFDISRCDNLWYLDCGNSEIKEVVVSNQSALKEIIFLYHCSLDVNLKSFNFIRATLDRNNGSITILYEE